MWRAARPDAITVLEDKAAKKSLRRYFAVLQDKKLAKFVLAKKLQADFTEVDSLTELLAEHAKVSSKFCSFEREIDDKKNSRNSTPSKSYLDLKIEIAHRIIQSCRFCARRCGVNRLTTGLGYCGCGSTMMVSSIFAHLGEEPELVPSGTIFTMGCTIRCHHCQNWTISQWKEDGTEYKPEELAMEIEQLHRDGCRNVNLVGGEPTPWLKQWLETFKHASVNVPVVWNSNSYYSIETARLLAGFVDVYLLDFKYGPANCAERISDAVNYWQICTRNHLEAKKNGELIIRVLVLPKHLDCCVKPILEWISENLGAETRINLLFQYRPEWHAHEIPELRRRLSKEEIEQALQLARRAGLKNIIT
ncbi:MAG: radical SAM protein [Chloroflexota bacterium]